MQSYDEFSRYYQEHMPQVFGFVFMRTNQNRSLAEDIVSEIFLKALENFEQYSAEKGSFKSWIFQITKNYLIDHFRAKKNQPSASIDDLANQLHDGSDTGKKAQLAIEKEIITQAVNELPEEKKELVILRYFSGYSYEEISEIINDNPNNTRVKLHRILQELKRKLAKLNQ